jgi:hypothetical protein
VGLEVIFVVTSFLVGVTLVLGFVVFCGEYAGASEKLMDDDPPNYS